MSVCTQVQHGNRCFESGAVFQMPQVWIQADLLQFGYYVPEVLCKGS